MELPTDYRQLAVHPAGLYVIRGGTLYDLRDSGAIDLATGCTCLLSSMSSAIVGFDDGSCSTFSDEGELRRIMGPTGVPVTDIAPALSGGAWVLFADKSLRLVDPARCYSPDTQGSWCEYRC
jgi:hypothetical protein